MPNEHEKSSSAGICEMMQRIARTETARESAQTELRPTAGSSRSSSVGGRSENGPLADGAYQWP